MNIDEAHKILYPSKDVPIGVVTKCNNIKRGIMNMFKKNKINKITRLAYEAKIPPTGNLKELAEKVQKYYMDMCLSISPETSTELGMLWGYGTRVASGDRTATCYSILRKINQAYGDKIDTPNHVISLLYDPEIGLVYGSEYYQRTEKGNYDMVDLAASHASNLIIWKVVNPTGFPAMYRRYMGDDNIVNRYVSPNPRVNGKEDYWFRQYHTYYDMDKKLQHRAEAIVINANNSFAQSVQNRAELGENVGRVPKLTIDEAEFILRTHRDFINGKIPIYQTWSELCQN